MNNFKIESHNKKYKMDIAKAVEHMYSSDVIDEYFKINYLDKATWSTEKNDQRKNIKYIQQPFWTKKALKHVKVYGTKGLRHEHSIPRNIVKQKIIDSKKDANSLFKILDNLSHAVITTKREAQELDKFFKNSLPTTYAEFDIRNDVDFLFSRYIEFNKISTSGIIEIYYLNEEQRLNLKTTKSLDINLANRII
jgi:hypothetical protein